MRKSILATLLLAALLLPLSFAFAQKAKRGRGKVLVLSQDANGQALASVPFSVNGTGRSTDSRGRRLLKLKAGKSYTFTFQDFSSYILLTPEGGEKRLRVKSGKTKKLRARFQLLAVDPEEVCSRPVDLSPINNPDHVVGSGTPESCTETALRAAIADGGVIVFNCGSSPHTISLNSELLITSDTLIDGENLITLSGSGKTRIINMDTGNFEATGPELKIQRLTFTGGKASGTAISLGTDIDGGGGAIFYRGGSVTVIDSVFSNNQAALSGPDVAGGAIYGIGVGSTTVVGSQFISNQAANGGAIGSLHTALGIYNSSFSSNQATGSGANSIGAGGQQQGSGGNGGAISMDGNGRTLNICGSSFVGNSAGALGGVLFRTGYETEPSIIHQSNFIGNSVRDNSDSSQANGAGAIYLQGTNVSLSSSTISGNSARAFAGVWILGHGSTPAIASLSNVTLAENFTYERSDFTNRGIGGGLIIGDNTSGTVLNCSILNNHAQFGSGILNASALTIRNSIISNFFDNQWTPLNCTGRNYSSPPGTGENNIQWPVGIQDDMDCTAGISRVDPLMSVLADNGGNMLTIAPLAGSPALAAGTDCPETDQLGNPRQSPCTLGALEWNP